MDKTVNPAGWYASHYDILGHWMVRPADKVMLGDKQKKACRFCNQSSPQVTFKLEAHAIPEALGNKSISSYYECDDCNQLFGKGIENDLGNWTKPMRTFGRIRGKNGIPTLRKDGPQGWRIEFDSKFKISEYEDDPVSKIDAENKRVRFTLTRDTYTPVAVLKAFMKIGLTLMPESEIANFPHALAWIRELDHSKPFAKNCPTFYTFIPGPMPNDLLVAWVLRRKEHVVNVPYAWLILAYGSEVFQVMIPSQAKGDGLSQPQTIYRFPTPDMSASGYDEARVGNIDLCGSAKIKGEPVSIEMGFEELRQS